ncbi:MAG: YkgJ family cysteine cluster protein [Desulfovibrionaceae bacterium]
MNQPDDPGICKRCALLGATCCELSPGNEENCFPLSLDEKERIQTEVQLSGGFALQENTKAFIDGMCRLFPDEARLVRELFPERKFHFRLAVDSAGRCRFLGPQGCVIPTEARPYYCRLFPLWMGGDRITVFNTLTCLARKEAVHQKALLESLGVSAASVRDLMGRLRLVWGLPPRPGMRRVKKTF